MFYPKNAITLNNLGHNGLTDSLWTETMARQLASPETSPSNDMETASQCLFGMHHLILEKLQRDQYRHDKRNHADIMNLHRIERLKHFGLHFAKYVGRLARESNETKPIHCTIVDTFLIGLSAANTLDVDLSKIPLSALARHAQIDSLRLLADAAGRFADACEKIDHLEEFRAIAQEALHDIIRWSILEAAERKLDLEMATCERRNAIAAKQFYIKD